MFSHIVYLWFKDNNGGSLDGVYLMFQVSGLMAMGFTENACKRAVLAVSNAGVEEASAWLFNHLDDAGTTIENIIVLKLTKLCLMFIYWHKKTCIQ